MQQAKRGDTVHVHYKGRLEDGTEFDSSEGREPLQFQLGSGQVVPGFEAAVDGMSEGEKKTAKIVADEAYGDRREDLMFQVPKSQLPPGAEVEVGDMLQVGLNNGETVPVQVAALDEEHLTLDANHPLAGKDLTFDLELVKIG